MWFEKLTGFTEKSPNYVRENLVVDGDDFISKINNKRFSFGKLEISTLFELKNKSPKLSDYKGTIQVSEIVADVNELHCDIKNSNALNDKLNLWEMKNGYALISQEGLLAINKNIPSIDLTDYKFISDDHWSVL